jgi:hypothetical protein
VQLAHLTAQALGLLALLAAQELVARAGVGLGLADSLSQRLGMDARVGRDVGDRRA